MDNPFAHVGTRRFANERPVHLSVDSMSEVSPEAQVALGLASEANRLGLKGEKVIFATHESAEVVTALSPFIRLITRTRTQRFLARITRSL